MILTAAICFACPVAQQSGGEAPLQLGERSFFLYAQEQLLEQEHRIYRSPNNLGAMPLCSRASGAFMRCLFAAFAFLIFAHLDSQDYTRQTCV